MSKQSTMMKTGLVRINAELSKIGLGAITEANLTEEQCDMINDGIKTLEVKFNPFLRTLHIAINESTKEEVTVLDGHFWVVKDGKVIQDTTGENALSNVLKGKARGIAPADKAFAVYLPVEKSLGQAYLDTQLEKVHAKRILRGQSLSHWEKEQDSRLMTAVDCLPNSIRVQRHHGGEIVFGHFGIMDSRDGNIHWMFGHPENTPAEYENRQDGTPKYSHDTNISNHPELRYLQEQVDARIKREEADAIAKTLATAKKAEEARKKAEDELFAMDEKDKKKGAGGGKTKKGGKK